jgi:integrase
MNKTAFRMFRRGTVYWCQNNQTGKQESLRTKDKGEARALLDLKNQPLMNAGFHQQAARFHQSVSDPKAGSRTWQNVMDVIVSQKEGSTKIRWERAAQSKAFDPIRNLVVANTKAEDFLAVLASGQVSANVYLRRLHNFALDMNWLLAPVIAKRAWPKVEYGEKRAITADEHRRIIEREKNPERKAYYQLCWHLGASQSDVADLERTDIDLNNREISLARFKNSELASITIGTELEQVLRELPVEGKLFPNLARVRESDRATEFKQRCTGLGIAGITLHSYRYAWAERAKTAGVPERYAQSALGHGSKAFSRAYAKNAVVRMRSLEEFEQEAAQNRSLFGTS